MEHPTRKRCALQPLSENVGAEPPNPKRRASGNVAKPTQSDNKATGDAITRRTTRRSSVVSSDAGPATRGGGGATTSSSRAGAHGNSILSGASGIPGLNGGRPTTRRSAVLTGQLGPQPAAAPAGAGAGAAAPAAGMRSLAAHASGLPPRQQQPQQQQQAVYSTPAAAARTTRAALQRALASGTAPASPPLAATPASPLHVPASYAKRRLSAARKPQQGMDRLQNEYEALQQKLALLKRDAQRGPAATPVAASAPRPARAAEAAETPAGRVGGGALPGVPEERPQRLAANASDAAPSESDATACAGAAAGPLAAADAKALRSVRFSERGEEGSAVCAAAEEVYEGDGEFLRLCEQALGAQLQKTKEGATSQSRILELAGLVKLLRRCLRESLSKAAALVDKGLALEQEMLQEASSGGAQVSGPARRRLEADVALARKEAAQMEATYKADRAQWMQEVDMGKFEVSRLNRELEALEEQRTRARDDAQKADKARIQLEAEIKELRKSADQRMREAHMTQGEAVKALSQERGAFEKAEAQLKERIQGLEEEVSSSQQQAASLGNQLAALQAAQQSLQASLEGKQTAEAALAVQLAQSQGQVAELRAQLSAAQGEKAALQQELRAAQNQVTLLESDVRLKGTRLEAAEQSLAAEREHHTQEASSLEEQLQSAQSGRAAAQSDALVARAEADDARRQAGDAAAARSRAEAALHQLQQQHEALQSEHGALKLKAEALGESEAAAREATAAQEARAAGAEEALAAAKEEAAAQASRLAHLEGEFLALQEMMGEGEQRDMVGRLLSRISALQCAAAAAEATRRQLHNQMVELRGNIRVFCRVRPHPHSVVRCLQGGTALSLALDGKEHPFSFDKVFAPQATQAQIFGEVSELVQSALDGYHVCLFSYGQTGAGKTHTMQGAPTKDGAGIIPRAVELILQRVDALASQEWAYTLEASFIEVYNNTLRDLLAEGAARSADAGRIPDANAIKHDPAGGHTTVAGATRAPVTGAARAAELVKRASDARACAETAMNASSSRSHCVFMLYISGVHAASGTRLTGCLCLVDLAGSERLDRSLAEGKAKKEACSINQSLSALGDVFASLSSKSPHVPYRNSKLTYLLQPCLGGNGKTLMFVNINPEPASAAESLCSLKFAAKVNGCETGAKGGARRNVTVAPGGAGGAGGSGAGVAHADVASAQRPGAGAKRGGPAAGAADKTTKRSRLG